MRKRDRFRNMQWLAGWRGIPDSENTAIDDLECRSTLVEAFRGLCQMGFLVEVEAQQSSYSVRCLPMPELHEMGVFGLGMSYTGEHLGNVLSAALYEAGLVRYDAMVPIISAKERVRWARS